MKNWVNGILGAGVVMLVAILAISSFGFAAPASAAAKGKIAVEYPYVDLDGANCVKGQSNCLICPGAVSATQSSGEPSGALCADYIEASGNAKLTWTATFHQHTVAYLQKSGTVYPGQKILFTFIETQGSGGYCTNGDNPCPAVEISGPSNSVWISFLWD